MSGTSEGAAGNDAMKPATVLLIVTVGVAAFIAMLVLGAYAPDLRSGHDGGSHALSNAATGFSGLVQLAEATGREPLILRAEDQLKSEDLVVVTPPSGSTDLTDVLAARGPRATLLVLPKWDTAPDATRGGWVTVDGLLDAQETGRMLAPAFPLTIHRNRGRGSLEIASPAAPADVHFAAPAVLQTMAGKGLQPIIVDGFGRVVLAKVPTAAQLYVLSDPDLLNNHAMGSERQARAALALLDYVNSTGAKSVLFDVTTNGLGRSRSPLRLAFDVPFLGVTLTIFAAMMLAAWQALVRFGPIRRRERAIAFGKLALVANTAALIRKARRETHLGGRYADAMRERAASLIGISTSADPQVVDARIEAANQQRSFAAASAAARDVQTPGELLLAARSLNRWLQEIHE